MSKEIDKYLADLLPQMHRVGIELGFRREIAYGVQLELFHGVNERLVINIYHSQKKGISALINKGGSPSLKQIVTGMVYPQKRQSDNEPEMHHWKSWIGSDECGKGDYYGALVVASFALKEGDLPKLRQMGVCDSKALKDPRIIEIAKEAYREFPGQSNSLILKPAKYNEVYEGFKRQGKNLNDLLAWQHSTVITELFSAHPSVDGVLIDQFSMAKKATQQLKTKLPLLNVVERTKAEADAAVAMASIMARFQFLQAHQEMRAKYKLDFPLGASSIIFDVGEQFVEQYGFERLGEVAKLHFISTAKLQQRRMKV